MDWDIFWANKEWIRSIYDKIHLESHQRVNHFRNFYELTRKDLLVKNLKRAKRSLAKKGREDESGAWDFFPDTYCLPAEYSLFVEAFKKAPGISWIMKPVRMAQRWSRPSSAQLSPAHSRPHGAFQPWFRWASCPRALF